MSRYVMHRGWQDHPLFDGDEFSRRDAWEWLIAEAAWKETRKRVAGKMIVLKRGQLSHSIRFMAEKWRWSKSRVERFLVQLKNETMIETVGGTAQIIVSICKYEHYQLRAGRLETEIGTLFGTPPGQQRDKEEEGKEGSKIDVDCNAGERAIAIVDYCKCRFNAPWPYIAAPVYAWLDWGADLEKDVKPIVERYIASKRTPPKSLTWLNDQIAASIEQRSRPMPKTTKHGGNHDRPSLFGNSAERDYDADARGSRFRVANPPPRGDAD